MTIIEVRDLSRTYIMGEVPVVALRSVTFTIEENEYVAITGHSGSGKSTLLNLLGCLDTPTSGTYHLAGKDVSHMSDNELSDIRRDRIGFVFQSFNLIPRLTVVENVELPLVYASVPTARRHELARRAAERVGLGHRIGHRPTELSGGEIQRVAIARALANDPVMVLADEPTGNLDTRTGAEILALIDQVWRQGATIVVVTHDLEIARSAHRVIQLRDGVVIDDSDTGKQAAHR